MRSLLFGLLLLVAVVLCCFKNKQRVPPHGKHPLILIPGTGGSRIYATDKNSPDSEPDIVWAKVGYVLRPTKLIKKLALTYDPDTDTYSDNPAYKLEVPGWGDVYTIANLDKLNRSAADYFNPLLNELQKDPYLVPGVTLRGAPYDFRRDPRSNKDFNPNMRQLIEDTYTLGGSQRVVLLAHSMGTLYSLQFLDSVSDKWKQKYIEAYVAVGGPFGGAVKSLKGVVSGDNFDTFVGDPLDFRVLERSMPSVLLMLPSPKLWSPDEVVVQTPENTYTVHDYERLFRDIGYKHGYKMWQGTRRNTDFMKGPTGVKKVICIHSSSLSTIGKLSYNQKSEGDRGFPDEIPEQTFEDGDGTVNIRSLEVCKQWKDVQYIVIPGLGHKAILSKKPFLKILWRILSGEDPS